MYLLKQKFLSLFVVSLALLCQINTLSGQGRQYSISGVVLDSLTREPLPYVMVAMDRTGVGTMTDEVGRFSFRYAFSGDEQMSVSTIGYQDGSMMLSAKDNDSLIVRLKSSSLEMEEIVIKSKRQKYKRKGNPAVELVERLIADKKRRDPKENEYYSYNRYEKIILAFNDFGQSDRNKLIRKLFKFTAEHIDTCDFTGNYILPISIKELSEDVYLRNRTSHTYVKGIRRIGLDQKFGEESNQVLLNGLFGQIDIREGDVKLLSKRFISPLSAMAPTFYRFHILDTVEIKGQKYTDLFFAPANLQSLGFTGHLYITADSLELIHKLKMRVPDDININFVNSIDIEQTFEQTEQGYTVQSKDDLLVELNVLPSKRSSIYGRRTDTYRDFSFSVPDDTISTKGATSRVVPKGVQSLPDSFWVEARHMPLTPVQDQIDEMVAKFDNMPLFRFAEGFTATMITGFVPTSRDVTKSKVDLGLINTFISNNKVEGWRFRLGGMTTTEFSKRFFVKGYGAYGLMDKQWKYQGQLEYSFVDKSISPRDFPIHSISASHSYDVYQPGLNYLSSNKDNFWLSLKRQPDTLMNYVRNTDIIYTREFRSGFSYMVDARQYTTYPSDYLRFTMNDTGADVDKLSMFESGITLRYAPKEQIFQSKDGGRRSVASEAPILTLSHSVGIKGVMGSEYNVNKTEFSFEKRQWMSMFGFIECNFKAGMVWDKAPWLLLDIPNADLSYTLQPGAFTLMNPMEFINDKYIYLDLSYHLNGLLLNRIPLIKALKLREVVTFKGLYGSLSDKNNPALSSGLYAFPEGTTAMEKKPYIEVGVGIDNIIRFLRLDYFWRMSYLDAPGINRGGIRISATIQF